MLSAGEKKKLGDPRTRRLQAYSTVADVFQLYSTLLGNPEWEKFRFVGSWNTLSDEQRRTHYNEMACHELDFFLYHHDRPFFDRVVKPLLANKLDKQLVDRWLLGESLAEYEPLWRTQRLNTLERILLAERIDSRQAGTKRPGWTNSYRLTHYHPPLDNNALRSHCVVRRWLPVVERRRTSTLKRLRAMPCKRKACLSSMPRWGRLHVNRWPTA
ncbi:MAG: hypothetical protein R3C56_39445 [Pirellulaceae bacterium]